MQLFVLRQCDTLVSKYCHLQDSVLRLRTYLFLTARARCCTWKVVMGSFTGVFDFFLKICGTKPMTHVGEFMSYLRYLCLLGHNGVKEILFCVFCFVFLRPVYLVLLVSLDCPFLITPNVY